MLCPRMVAIIFLKSRMMSMVIKADHDLPISSHRRDGGRRRNMGMIEHEVISRFSRNITSGLLLNSEQHTPTDACHSCDSGTTFE